ncbi:MAG: hypothetical protein VKL39_01400 [Leptolyngbyaceae bacterium]|nr:hypothetical protein [Leptolyngbyaceae bacterium]
MTRRLPSRTIQKDVHSLNGLGAIENYVAMREDASPEALKQRYSEMLAMRQKETEMAALYKASVDRMRQAEWDFHNSVMLMKDCVRAQFGPDSNESQSIGYKKKSERKRPRRSASSMKAAS